MVRRQVSAHEGCQGAARAILLDQPNRFGFLMGAMSSWKKTLAKVMSAASDANVRYSDLCTLLNRLGYTASQGGGSHRVFRFPGRDLINLQGAGGMAKGYQVRQVRDHLNKYQK